MIYINFFFQYIFSLKKKHKNLENLKTEVKHKFFVFNNYQRTFSRISYFCCVINYQKYLYFHPPRFFQYFFIFVKYITFLQGFNTFMIITNLFIKSIFSMDFLFILFCIIFILIRLNSKHMKGSLFFSHNLLTAELKLFVCNTLFKSF